MGVDVITMEDCSSNYGIFKVIGSKGDTYVVTMNGSEGPAHCTCKAYEFCKQEIKECKHIHKVWAEACMYNPQWRNATRFPKLKPIGHTYDRFSKKNCECGDKLVYVRRAV